MKSIVGLTFMSQLCLRVLARRLRQERSGAMRLYGQTVEIAIGLGLKETYNGETWFLSSYRLLRLRIPSSTIPNLQIS